MIGSSLTLNVLQQRKDKLADRRRFFHKTGGFALGVAGGAVLAACGGRSDDAVAESSVSDPDILNFALNLEYLEAQFYSYAVNGSGLPANILSGTGTMGAVTPGHAVSFSDPLVQQYAREIAADELAHVIFLCGRHSVHRPSRSRRSMSASPIRTARSPAPPALPAWSAPVSRSILMRATRTSCSARSSSRMWASPATRALRL